MAWSNLGRCIADCRLVRTCRSRFAGQPAARIMRLVPSRLKLIFAGAVSSVSSLAGFGRPTTPSVRAIIAYRRSLVPIQTHGLCRLGYKFRRPSGAPRSRSAGRELLRRAARWRRRNRAQQAAAQQGRFRVGLFHWLRPSSASIDKAIQRDLSDIAQPRSGIPLQTFSPRPNAASFPPASGAPWSRTRRLSLIVPARSLDTP